MIGYLKGKILTTQKNKIIIDNNGIGYEISIKESLVNKISSFKGEVELFIHTHFFSQEFRMELYGFEDLEEKKLFTVLLSLPKIGPKAALSILSSFSLADIMEIVYGNQIDRMVTVPGIGKKTAERIILELKDKLKGIERIEVSGDDSYKELIQALTALGFTPQDASRVAELTWKKRKDDDNIESLIKQALILSR